MADQAQVDVVAGYPVVRRLGAGGMGAVYLVRHPHLHRLVALKVMTAGADDQRARARFLREAALAASLSHPHLVTVYDQDEVDGVLHLTMQHVDGPDLRRLLGGRALPHDEVAEGVLQLADALDALHDAGLVHRDVKPSNVLVATGSTGWSRWMLADFGIARTLDETSELTGAAFVGSVAYSAPERFRGDPGSRSTDVFALACLAHEALTGAPPFGRDLHSVLGSHAASAPPAGLAGLPPRVADALRSGLSLTPRGRPATAGAFAAALADAIRNPSGPRAVGRPCDRRRAALVVALVAGVVATLVLVLVLPGSLADDRAAGATTARAGASSPPRLQALTELPGETVPGQVAADGAGGAWVTDDAGARVFHVRADGAVWASTVPVTVDDGGAPPMEEAARGDGPVPRDAPTASRRLLRADQTGGAWFSDGTQVGRIRSTGDVDVLAGGAPAVVVDLLADEGGVWLSLRGGGVLRVVDSGGRLGVDPVAVPPDTARRAEGPGEVWTVPDGDGGSWALDGGQLVGVRAGAETVVTTFVEGPVPGSELVRGPDGALFWLDDATGRVGRYDPSSASPPEFLPLPLGHLPRGLATTPDRLLVTTGDAGGGAALLVLPPDGQVVEPDVTDEQRAAVSQLVDDYEAARRACGITESRAAVEAQLPCLVGPLRALESGLKEVKLPGGADVARDGLVEVTDVTAGVFAVLADPRAAELHNAERDPHPTPPARVLDVAMSLDRLEIAMGSPRGGVAV